MPSGHQRQRRTPGEASSQLCADSSVDNDGDGYTENDGDCDDEDPTVNPDAIDGTEAPYGVSGDDADCDGQLDDGACDDDDDGYSEVDGDCDDDLAAVNPIAEEITDGVDNDCNGCIDDVDGDRDGVSECVTGEVVDCDPDDEIECTASTFDPFDAAGAVLPAGYEEGDCAVAWDTNDADNLINPCAPEVRYDGIDQSGDGFDNCDLDGDGYDKEQNADPALGCVGNPDPGFWAERPEDCDDNDRRSTAATRATPRPATSRTARTTTATAWWTIPRTPTSTAARPPRAIASTTPPTPARRGTPAPTRSAATCWTTTATASSRRLLDAARLRRCGRRALRDAGHPSGVRSSGSPPRPAAARRRRAEALMRAPSSPSPSPPWPSSRPPPRPGG